MLRDPLLLRRVVDFVASSLARRPFQELLAQYLALVRPFGFAHVGMIDMSSAEPHPIAGLCFTTFPVETVTRFAKSPHLREDPVWKAALKGEAVLRWSDAVGVAGKADALYRSEGLVDGLVIPLSAPHIRRAVIFLGADRAIELDDTIAELLKVASGVLATHAPLLEDRFTAPKRLTERERQVLTQTAFGKGAREIGVDLEMSEKTVARHLLNVRVKLGAANTVHAVVLALRQKQIQI